MTAFQRQEVWERFGIDVKEAISTFSRRPKRRPFQQLLFAKIVPNCKRVGLLDANDGWLRKSSRRCRSSSSKIISTPRPSMNFSMPPRLPLSTEGARLAASLSWGPLLLGVSARSEQTALSSRS